MDTSMLKLKQLLSSRYGKGLELRPLMDMSKLAKSSDAIVSGNDLFIPIVVQEQFLGTAVIPHGWELSDDKRKGIAQLVRMVLEPKLYNEYLERRESNLNAVHNLGFPESNLIVFGDDHSAEVDKSYLLETTSFTTSLIHLQGKQGTMIKKVALQIHEFSGRWAFVPFEDVQQDLNTVADICNLGGMTLYIENVEKLSAKAQSLLNEYLSSPRSLEEPLILTSSTVEIGNLGEFITEPVLLEEIENTNLEVERAPLTSAALREVIELVFNHDETQGLH
ncbi:MAG: hypothetical protein H7326_03830 [Bdellovibrionaceae bacterium]|nr:hypothetical protein [Pseudobdellovibrionaceae bacterium]